MIMQTTSIIIQARTQTGGFRGCSLHPHKSDQVENFVKKRAYFSVVNGSNSKILV